MDAPAVVRRTLGLASPADDASLASLRSAAGVTSVRPSADGRRIEVTYDPTAIDLPRIEAAFTAAGLRLDDGLFARLGRRWAAFQEANTQAQSKIVHQCCNQAPAPPRRTDR